jgi:hypothetical protein
LSYKLIFPILVPVENMLEENTIGLTQAKMADALRNMADQVERGDIPLETLVGREPLTVYREDRWVMYSIRGHEDFRLGDPVWVRAPSGGWSKLKSGNILPKHTMTSEEALEAEIPDEVIFARPEDIGGRPVLAEVRSEDGSVYGKVDMSSWLAWSATQTIESCIRGGWDFPQDVLYPCEDSDNPLHNEPMIRRGCDLAGGVLLVIPESEREFAMSYLDSLSPGFSGRFHENINDAGMEP